MRNIRRADSLFKTFVSIYQQIEPYLIIVIIFSYIYTVRHIFFPCRRYMLGTRTYCQNVEYCKDSRIRKIRKDYLNIKNQGDCFNPGVSDGKIFRASVRGKYSGHRTP